MRIIDEWEELPETLESVLEDEPQIPATKYRLVMCGPEDESSQTHYELLSLHTDPFGGAFWAVEHGYGVAAAVTRRFRQR